MAIAIALPGLSDLGRSITPYVSFQNKILFTKKSIWEVEKVSRFLSTGHGILPSCGCKARETHRLTKCT